MSGKQVLKMKKQTKFVAISLLVAIMAVLALTPLGFVPLGFTRATTMHIPVIVGAILFGPATGAFLGFVFGAFSLIINTVTPTLGSFVFTPFFSLGEGGGSPWSLVVCFVPRILIGVFAALCYRALRRALPNAASAGIAGFVGSFTNTLLVMSGIVVFFADRYSALKSVPASGIYALIGGIIAVNGLPEAIVAAIVTAGAVPALMKAVPDLRR